MQRPQINQIQPYHTPQRVFNRISPQINMNNIQFQNGNDRHNKTLIQPVKMQQPKINNNNTNVQSHLQHNPQPQVKLNPQNIQIPQQLQSQINQQRVPIQYSQPHGVPLNNIKGRLQTQPQIQQKKPQIIPVKQNKNLIQTMANNNQNKINTFNGPINQSINQINQIQMMKLNLDQVGTLQRLNIVNNVNNNLQNGPIRNVKTMTNQIQQNKFGFQNVKGQNIMGVQTQNVVGGTSETQKKLQFGQKTYVSIIK
jgi:hypothetical protein